MEIKPRTCIYCNQTFTDMNGRVFANHVRWCDKNTTNGDKGRSAISKSARTRHDENLGKVMTYTKICALPQCNNTFTVKCRESNIAKTARYCNKCRHLIGAHTPQVWSDEMLKQISDRSKRLWKQPDYIEKQLKNNMGSKGNRRFTSKGEEEVRKHFKTKFPHDEWTHGGSLKMGEHRLVRDLFSKKLKICIEYDGIWHFKDIKGQLEHKQVKDAELQEWCIRNGWRLIRIDENVYNSDKQSAIQLLESYVYASTESVVKIGDRYQNPT